jgi:Flp pilus assembly protein TadB
MNGHREQCRRNLGGNCSHPDLLRAGEGFNSGDISMNLDRAVLAFAGVMILLSVVLVYFVSPWWLLLTAFVGLNLLQASFTGFCPAEKILARIFPEKPQS